MAIHRASILEKLNEFLEGAITPMEVHEWVLFTATSSGYEEVSKNDPLIAKVMEALINIDNQNPAHVPPRELLIYYQKCLAGELPYQPVESKAHLKQMLTQVETEVAAAPPAEQPQMAEDLEEKSEDSGLFGDALTASRIYVIIFGVCTFVVHFYSVINPMFLRFGEDVPTRLAAIQAAMPELVYAYFILLPQTLTAQRAYFFVAFPIITFGMFYYWYMSMTIVSKLSLNFIFILSIAPFCAVPATLALLLLIIRREEYNTRRRRQQLKMRAYS